MRYSSVTRAPNLKSKPPLLAIVAIIAI